MEFDCASCGCVVERGVRTEPSGLAACCCDALPVQADLDTMANQIREAFAAKDIDAFGRLLTDDARWGDDTHPNRCRSRDDVVATFRRVLVEGADGHLVETSTGARGVMCLLRVKWPSAEDLPEPVFYHVYLIRDGKVAEIRRYDDRESALAALQPG